MIVPGKNLTGKHCWLAYTGWNRDVTAYRLCQLQGARQGARVLARSESKVL